MSKFNFKSINYQSIANGFADLLRSNSGTIVGGLSMIGLALLCRKLNIPYTVLSEPFGTVRRYDLYSKKDAEYQPFIYMPSDEIEGAIAAIYDVAAHADFDSQRLHAAKDIFDILAARKDEITSGTKVYATTTLRTISSHMDFDSGRRSITQLIAKIGKGEF